MGSHGKRKEMTEDTPKQNSKKRLVTKDTILIAIISVLLPFAGKTVLDMGGEPEDSETMSIKTVDTESILWLNSPVTQAWEFDPKKQTWQTVTSYKDSFRSPPSMVIGLRDDGVVVWRSASDFNSF